MENHNAHHVNSLLLFYIHLYKFQLQLRRRQDSNLRAPYEANGFQDRRLKPLSHASVRRLCVSLQTTFRSCIYSDFTICQRTLKRSVTPFFSVSELPGLHNLTKGSLSTSKGYLDSPDHYFKVYIANIQTKFVKSKYFSTFFCGDGKSWTSVWALWEPRSTVRLHRHRHLERCIGIEPTSSAWQADILTVVLTPHVYHSQPDHFFNKDFTSWVIGTLLSFLCLSFLAPFLDECLLWASVFIQGSGCSPYESPIFNLI